MPDNVTKEQIIMYIDEITSRLLLVSNVSINVQLGELKDELSNLKNNLQNENNDPLKQLKDFKINHLKVISEKIEGRLKNEPDAVLEKKQEKEKLAKQEADLAKQDAEFARGELESAKKNNDGSRTTNINALAVAADKAKVKADHHSHLAKEAEEELARYKSNNKHGAVSESGHTIWRRPFDQGQRSMRDLHEATVDLLELVELAKNNKVSIISESSDRQSFTNS